MIWIADGVLRSQRPHRHHHRAGKRAGRRAVDVGAVHGNPEPLLDVAERYAVLDEGLLERIGAANHERHEILAPPFGDVGGLLDELAVLPDAVARQVGADVEIETQRGDVRIADVGHPDQRARLGIGLTEAQEIRRKILRQDGKIALHIPRRDAGCRGAQAAAPAGKPGRKPGQQVLVAFDFSCWFCHA